MKVNLIFDANYLFRKTLGVFAGYGAVDPAEVFSTLEDRAAFIRKVTMDFCSTLRYLPTTGRIIMCADSSSWRKLIEIENGGYKSGRKKDENVDWSIFYQLMHEFCQHLDDLGYTYTKVNSAEADDLIYFWSKYFAKHGEHSIIITGDRDLHQLIKNSSSGGWTCVLNNNSKNLAIYTPYGWKEEMNRSEVSIFNMSDSISPEKSKLKELSNNIEVVEVDPKSIVLEKILSGDKGDSVPSVWLVDKKGKLHGMTPKKAEDLYTEIKQSKWSNLTTKEILNDPEVSIFISGFCLRSLGDVDSSENRHKLLENLERNKKLVWLDKAVIPKEIAIEILECITENVSREFKKIPVDRDSILKGTEWVTEGYVPKNFNPFSL
jgi:5'-3' exonuclease